MESQVLEEFLKCKENIQTLSHDLLDMLNASKIDYDNIDFEGTKFEKLLISLQNQVSILLSLSTNKPHGIEALHNQMQKIIKQIIVVHQNTENILSFASEFGALKGMITSYLIFLSEIEFKLNKRKISIDLQSLSLSKG